jgi:hypothetical protein
VSVKEPALLSIGDKFDTPFESNCTVTGDVDAFGNFLALDSDNVECLFNVVMIVEREREDK